VGGEPVKFKVDRPDTVEPLYSAPLELEQVVRVIAPKVADGAEVTVRMPSWDYDEHNVPRVNADPRRFTFVGSLTPTPVDRPAKASAWR